MTNRTTLTTETISCKGWWSGFRIYGLQAPAFDGMWKLNDTVEVKWLDQPNR